MYYCRTCNLETKAQNYAVRKVAYGLVDTHGLPSDEASFWALILCADQERCRICGVPNWFLRKQGIFARGDRRSNQHLTLDHITPGVNDGNYRPLCFSCNAVRGPAQFTDVEVLEEMRGWYEWSYPSLRKLHWLNTTPGEGGRPFRTERVARAVAELDGGNDG